MNKAAGAVCEFLYKRATKPIALRDVAAVATLSADGDEEFGVILRDAIEKISPTGAIWIMAGTAYDSYLETSQGFRVNQGFLSPLFASGEDDALVILREPVILASNLELTDPHHVAPLVEAAGHAGKPLLLLCQDFDRSVIEYLVDRSRLGQQLCAVKAPGVGDSSTAMVEDIAILTGGEAIVGQDPAALKLVTLDQLGSSQRAVSRVNDTLVIDTPGDIQAVTERTQTIEREMKATRSPFKKQKLQERLAMFFRGAGMIVVGGSDEASIRKRTTAMRDALKAVRWAAVEGIVPGGGTALVRAEKAVDQVTLTGDEAAGGALLRKTLSLPFRIIAGNAGADPDALLNDVRQDHKKFSGYDAASGQYTDLRRVGIVDPVKVVTTELTTAAQIVSLMLEQL